MEDVPPRRLKVVFFGAPSDYSMHPLEAVASAHEVVALVESAPRGSQVSGLGIMQKLGEVLYWFFGQPSLWLFARRRHLPYFYCSKRNLPQLPHFLKQVKADIGCIASFNLLFPEAVIDVLPEGIINFHPSLLPKYRGPFVWFWIYHQMDAMGGATIHYIDEGEDSGAILEQDSFPIPSGLPPKKLMHTAIGLGAKLMVSALNKISSGTASPTPQSHLPCPVRARRLKPGEDLLNWQDWTIAECFHFLQAACFWVNPFSIKHGFLGHLPWQAVSYQETPQMHNPGRIRLGLKGAYFAHPQGKIALRLSPRLTPFLIGAAALLFFTYQALSQ